MTTIRFNSQSYLVEVLSIANNGTITVRYEDGHEEWIYPEDWKRYLKNQSDYEFELKHQ
ncbi:hypothetical protein [Pelosinus propionicus]|uniref:Uncharacterized protein n=1 Tax=Pelosinus propionicus DSM 13327 TaxID=1123291 RepID=A0A1I4LJ29_9FIRM|nr:hypothetical protein [Pelosinus propionicus]SFL90836.1 hypothetical protein SAMN04490355_102513 [Pelosinus propionicus DSM 13327]